MKPALSKVNQHRNWVLRRATELIKSKAVGKNVQCDWKNRVVQVDGNDAFAQYKSDLDGTFPGEFSNLSILDRWG